MAAKPETISEYLKGVSPEKRAALQKLRKDIQSAAPRAEECIAYGIPTFRLDGKMLVSFGAATRHCAFYPGATPIREHKQELKEYDTEKGTIRFDAAHPLPTALIRKLVRTRIAERVTEKDEKARRKTAPRRKSRSE